MSVVFEDRPSPNHDARRPGSPVDILLLHYTGMASAEDALARLCDREAKVGCHWFVHEDGRIVRLIDEGRRAWHAGVSCWAGERDVNSRSVGIEIHNPGVDHGYRDFPTAQIEAVMALAREILARHAIAPERVLAHSDVAPARKVDPGERFPWQRLHEGGIGRWVAPAAVLPGPVLQAGDEGQAVAALQRDLARYGYCLACDGRFGQATATVVAAFQRHFRPCLVDGRADVSTRATLAALLGG